MLAPQLLPKQSLSYVQWNQYVFLKTKLCITKFALAHTGQMVSVNGSFMSSLERPLRLLQVHVHI